MFSIQIWLTVRLLMIKEDFFLGKSVSVCVQLEKDGQGGRL